MNMRFFWLLFLNVFITMIVIVIIKRTSAKFNVPVLSTISNEV